MCPGTPERVFRGPLWRQLREGAWPYVLAVVVPAALAVALLVHGSLSESKRGLWALAPLLWTFGHFAALLSGRARRRPGRVTGCCWVALGDGHLRLGMSFLRPRVLFQQLVDVEHGALARGRWEPRGGHARIRVRFVMPHNWEVISVAYPTAIDPSGELTAALQAAAAHNRARLGLREGAEDADITERYRQLEARYRAIVPASAEDDEPA